MIVGSNMDEDQQQSVEIKKKLKYILDISKCNHKIEILKEANIKRAHIYCKITPTEKKNETQLIFIYLKTMF